MRNKESNVISEVIRFYPANRLLTDCSRQERIFNQALKSLITLTGSDKRRLRNIMETVDNYILSLKSDGNQIDRWTIYSAAVIRFASMKPDWNYSEDEIRDFYGSEVADIIYKNHSWNSVFAFAEALIEVRERVYCKMTGNTYDEGLTVETTTNREARLRKAADDLENWQRRRINEYREYMVLLDRLFRDSYPVWEELHETGYEGFCDFLLNLPERMIIHKFDAYFIQDVTKYTEPSGEGSDDGNKESFESGLKVRLTKCVGDDELIVKIRDAYMNQMADVILKGNMLMIPDELTRDMIKELSTTNNAKGKESTWQPM